MEGNAGASQLNPTDADSAPDDALAVSPEEQTEEATAEQSTDSRG